MENTETSKKKKNVLILLSQPIFMLFDSEPP